MLHFFQQPTTHSYRSQDQIDLPYMEVVFIARDTFQNGSKCSQLLL